MRFILVTFAILAITCTSFALPQYYTTQVDNKQVDTILKNPRIVKNYIKCLLEKGPCTSEGRDLIRTLPEAIKTDCKKCTPTQKQVTDKVINHLKTKYKDDWKELIKKYDPENRNSPRYL